MMTAPVLTHNPYPRGTYAKIARRLHVTPQHVRNVALGLVKSARVTAELRREARKAEQKQEPQVA
jgi:predicted transcriptional regulator